MQPEAADSCKWGAQRERKKELGLERVMAACPAPLVNVLAIVKIRY